MTIWGSISFLFGCLGIILNPQAMLLGRFTIPVCLCLSGSSWNNSIIQVAALLFLLGSCSFKRILERSNAVLPTIFKALLLLIFVLDAFFPDISTAFFVIFHVLVIMLPLSSPSSEKFESNVELNDYLLKIIDELQNGKIITTENKMRILWNFYTFD